MVIRKVFKGELPAVKIAICQINPTLGDFSKNSSQILHWAHEAKKQDCDLIVFPESCVIGYPQFDLLERKEVVQKQLKVLHSIHKRWPKNLAGLVGVLTLNPEKKGRPYFNSAAWVESGKKLAFFHKQLLPTGDVFDEARFIEPGKTNNNFIRFQGKKILITICEDIWAWPNEQGISCYKENPLQDIARKKSAVDLILNLSASPFFVGKLAARRKLVQITARSFKAPVVYTNLVGGQDELIFDGGSFAVDEKGKLIEQLDRFHEQMKTITVLGEQAKTLKVNKTSSKDSFLDLKKALVLGLRDFIQKTRLERVHLGLSGGVDSAVVACLAVEALGAENVSAIAMPGPFSSDQSLLLAKTLAEKLGISMKTIPINDLYQMTVATFHKQSMGEGFQVFHENLQARLRGLILMGFANIRNSCLLATSNKSELATGYSTLYGDMCGGICPLGDLTKAQVYELANYYKDIIPSQIITRAPTAELKANQKDEDSLPPYKLLDDSVRRIVEMDLPCRNETDTWLLHQLAITEFKRWQAPPILKVSKRAFGRGRRWPIVNRSYQK